MAAKRKGFTLLELLVVISIVGILVALLVPAIQSAREAARRVSCYNNLKQTGVAMYVYHDTYRRLPAGWDAWHPSTDQPYWLGKPGWGWAARLLPFLEQEHVVDSQIDFDLPLIDPFHAKARNTFVPVYRCPSDPSGNSFILPAGPKPKPNYSTGYVDTEVPTANYIGVFGSIQMLTACGGGGDCVGNGSLVFHRAFRLRELRDGLSQTYIVGERNSKHSPSTWLGVFAGGAHAPGRIVAVATQPPNSDVGAPFNFSSCHPQGTNFLAADGSVHLVVETIDRDAYHALCTRAEGDSVR